ncbi:hypothetical protein BH23CHL2_BH23CHL2_34420 [soil metagenome]
MTPGKRERALTQDKLSRNYEKPFGWWGLERDVVEPLTLPGLISSGTLGAGEVALLSLAVEMRRSIIVIAEEVQAGKTTLLTALLHFMDPTTRPIYIRGLYERFEYLTELEPSSRYVLCNEISAHLPTYLWGQGVRHLFDGLDKGFPIATTMHAASADDALEMLQGYPLEVPAEHVADIDLIVTLKKGMVDGRSVRRVVAIDRVLERRGSPVTQQLAVRDPLRSAPQLHSGRIVAVLAAWGEIGDDAASRLLAAQERFLTDCVAKFATDPEGFYRELDRFRT